MAAEIQGQLSMRKNVEQGERFDRFVRLTSLAMAGTRTAPKWFVFQQLQAP
jgi:hypothetical protein